jgi:hypothetical protein
MMGPSRYCHLSPQAFGYKRGKEKQKQASTNHFNAAQMAHLKYLTQNMYLYLH